MEKRNPVVPVQAIAPKGLLQPSRMDIRVFFHGADGMAGVPEALPMELRQYLEYLFIPCFLHLPGALIGNDGDRLRISPIFPQRFKLLRHARHMEAGHHLDQLHPHFHVGFPGAGLFEIGLLLSRQGLEFIIAVYNLDFLLRVLCLFIQLHQLCRISVYVHPESRLFVAIPGNHFPQPPLIP